MVVLNYEDSSAVNYYVVSRCGNDVTALHIGGKTKGCDFAFFSPNNHLTTWNKWRDYLNAKKIDGAAIYSSLGERLSYDEFERIVNSERDGLNDTLEVWKRLGHNAWTLSAFWIDPDGFAFSDETFI